MKLAFEYVFPSRHTPQLMGVKEYDITYTNIISYRGHGDGYIYIYHVPAP